MSTINITITESEEEVIDGIPKFITIEANIACNIFYTLDGSTPDLNSSLVLGKIMLPAQFSTVTLKYFAINSEQITSVQTLSWQPTKSDGPKIFSNVKDAPIGDKPQKYNLFPFGSPTIPVPGQYDDTALEPVDAPDKPDLDYVGYNAEGEPSFYVDRPVADYIQVLSPDLSDRPNGIGTFGYPNTKSTPDLNNIPQFTSTKLNLLFNPRAMVIYQDGTDPNLDPEVSTINKMSYFSSDLGGVDAINHLFNPAHQQTPLGGNFLKYYIDQQNQTITFYYYDNFTGKWIISKDAYNSIQNPPMNLSQLIFPPDQPGARHVYRWIPFVKYRQY